MSVCGCAAKLAGEHHHEIDAEVRQSSSQIGDARRHDAPSTLTVTLSPTWTEPVRDLLLERDQRRS